VASWWLCYLPVVELMADKLVVASVGGWDGGEREGENKMAETKEKG